MTAPQADVVVAGHICLDMIPTIGGGRTTLETLFTPGRTNRVGPLVSATGGVVSNTGLSLHRLGVATRLVGKIGDDLIGRAILDVVRSFDPDLAGGIVVAGGERSSYTVVISAPGVDRSFLHDPGANDTFVAADVPDESLAGARLFHFGYPPIMRRMYQRDGEELEALFRRVKAAGLTTSLDTCMPDPDSEAGRINWVALFERVLPAVDIFMPSVEEILFMLDRERFERLQRECGPGGVLSGVDGPLLGELSGRLLQMGAALVALKFGDRGLYLRTTADAARLAALGGCTPDEAGPWHGRELLVPCYRAEVVGTTGAGDCTIAGFLAGFVRGLPPEEVMNMAVAVGACSVEGADAVSGVRPWQEVERRVRSGWERHAVRPALSGWREDREKAVWVGPHEKK